MHDDDYKRFSTSLEDMVKQIQSNLPHAKEQGFKAVGIDVSLDVAQSLIDALESHQAFKSYVTRRISELEADKKGQTMEVKAVLNGALIELNRLQSELDEERQVMTVEIVSTGKDTTLMQRPCVTLKVQGKLIKDVTEIKLKESKVAPPSLMFQIGGGIGYDQIHFYHEPDLRDVYAVLKKELEPQSIKFESVLTD